MELKLKQFRNSLKISQESFAKKLGISTSFYIKVELGERNPSFNFLKKLKKVFNVNIDEMFF
ncbi:helix-turn-helix transcriptional regulator [Clostridium sp.]|uniref:helix-turn-helix transcriptional regulator n=1 Tax=Clostridium sp. TaxID=1506 RepID=UPI002FDCB994